jgi:RNA polymerase sigma factor (sigma-70 family)
MRITHKILEGCKKNNRKAQKVLFDYFKARVMGFARRYTSTKEEAEDVFQEAFLKIFKNVKQVNDLVYLDRWMIKSTINTAINYYHKNKRHHDSLGIDNLEVFDERDSSIIDDLSNEVIIELINKLPTRYRLVFNLYVIEGYKHWEIAEMLKIPENTSKSQLSRAKSLLKGKLKELGIEKFENYG